MIVFHGRKIGWSKITVQRYWYSPNDILSLAKTWVFTWIATQEDFSKSANSLLKGSIFFCWSVSNCTDYCFWHRQQRHCIFSVRQASVVWGPRDGTADRISKKVLNARWAVLIEHPLSLLKNNKFNVHEFIYNLTISKDLQHHIHHLRFHDTRGAY